MKYRYKFHLPKNYNLRLFEQELAQLELQKLADSRVIRDGSSFTLETESELERSSLKRLTFIERVDVVNGIEAESFETYQVNVDRTASVDKRVISSNNLDLLSSVKVKRRTHNYLTHSLHKYKGKFYPQIAKSLINLSGLVPGDIILDPFCGSGTTLVECLLNGYRGLGVDLNPLAVLVARAKVDTLLLDPKILETELNDLISRATYRYRHVDIWDKGLNELIWADQKSEPSISLDDLQIPNQEYLMAWFEPIALIKLSIIADEISKIIDERVKNFARVVLSDIIRTYSLQVPDQLRIRRRKSPPDDSDLLLRFIDKLRKQSHAAHLVRALGLHERQSIPTVDIYCGDVTELSQIPSDIFQKEKSVDAIITSPPYATALPYIDTDRLSLFFFDFIKKADRKSLEWRMIGNREITKRRRSEIEEEFFISYQDNSLPRSVKKFIKIVFERNTNADVGFRRKNKASLLYKYFVGMRKAFIQFHRILKPGGSCSIIIGNNKTTAGGKLMEIPTDDFLIEIGESVGFKLIERLPMTDQAAYMAHSKNVIDTETIFVLERV